MAAGPNDITTPAGVRKPDVFVVPSDIARTAISGKVRTYYAGDLLLVAEVISPRSGSEQVDRVRKVREYARAGILLYWIVDLEPEAKVTILTSAAKSTPCKPGYAPGTRSPQASRTPSASTQEHSPNSTRRAGHPGYQRELQTAFAQAKETGRHQQRNPARREYSRSRAERTASRPGTGA